LLDGDGNPRHHMPGALGSFLIGAFVLTVIGLFVVLVRHWRDPWWRFVVVGAALSIVPGALTKDQFHSLRIVAYPIFLLLLMIPALQLLLEPRTDLRKSTSRFVRPILLGLLFAAMAAQAIYFQSVYRREGADRGYVFDSAYKDVYDLAVSQPKRPIYLIDGTEPAYVHALWYATIEGRSRDEFVHLDEGRRAPSGSIVIGSQPGCFGCMILLKSGDYMVYRSF
jgi:hypothetical protein